MEILLASNNDAKAERLSRLVAYVDPRFSMSLPSKFGLTPCEVNETGATLLENAILKASAYTGMTNLPVLSNDTGFFVEGEGFVLAPKRESLQGADTTVLTKDEIASRMRAFWKSIATKHGGEVNAAWLEAFVVRYPDGQIVTAESRRDVILTNQELGPAHPEFPVRALYYSVVTGKPAALHTPEQEHQEMVPVIEALRVVLKRYLDSVGT